MLISGLWADIFNKPRLDKGPWWRGHWKKGSGSVVPASRSKYTRHQGEREKERRIAQIKKGMIKP
ncbi:MAG: hypothetical protein ABIJ57_01070 [Pseudomonadota bacterium]